MSLSDRIAGLAARIGFEVGTKVDATHPALARAWVSFGYVAGQTVIHHAHGVASVERLAAGQYRVHFRLPARRRQLLLDRHRAKPRARRAPSAWQSRATADGRARSRPPGCSLRQHAGGLPCRLDRDQRGGVPLMAYSQAQLEALEAALAKGERRVTFGDKTVEYRTVEELAAAIKEVKRGLFDDAVNTGLWPGAPRQIRITTRKGT